MKRITSRQSPIVARFRAAARQYDAHLLLDGPHLIAMALDAGCAVEIAAVRTATPSDPMPSQFASLIARLEDRGAAVVTGPASVVDAMSPVRTPAGIVALAQHRPVDRRRVLEPAPALVVVAMGVQDPGNVGALIRSADAAGATGAVITAGSANPWSWKALRGSMGSAMRLPIWSEAAWTEVRQFLRGHGVRLLATAARSCRSIYDEDLSAPTAVMLGSEGEGLPADATADADGIVSVPMRDGIESLNVAVTAALVAYEARRQRTR